jgi:ubiquinone/menaquinone biosynthesis C-methylase UbiE
MAVTQTQARLERFQPDLDSTAARVADIGAGEGYFVPYLSRAVGPQGKVYAVEVDDERVAQLEARVLAEGLANVEVVRGRFEDPELPDAGIDRVLIVNTYHHIEDRSDYFARLRRDLRPGGRVAIIENDTDLTGVLSLFLDEGHTSTASEVREEMRSAGYRTVQSHDWLATQIFEVFAPGAP